MTDLADAEVGDRHRYRRLIAVLRQRIADGVYPVGGSLPTEGELCAEFSVSRFTVREALRRLVDLGMIARRQGSGSQVVSTEPKSAYVQSMRSLSELFEYALNTRLEVLSAGEEAVGSDEAPFVPATPGERWFVVRGIRRMPDRDDAICHVSAFVPARFAHLKADILATRGPIYTVVESHSGTPIAETVQEISGAPMPPAVRKALGLKPPAFALRFVRRYLDAEGDVLVTSINWHPAEGFTYCMNMRRSQGGEG
jgi:GntR family transcriptional regulator